ncbi:MAG: DUF998 domain-containing protein, partial [Planctomycetota bacterium]
MICLGGFAAVRPDDYSHGRKAVSELGAVGAPNALGFNLLGFVAPGLLVICLTYALTRSLRTRRCRVGAALLFASGLSMAMAGVFPVDMEKRDSLTSILHLVAASLSGIFWTLSLFWLGRVLRRDLDLPLLGRMTPWFSLFLVANLAWQAVWQSTGAVLPGWGQRIGFGGFFLWTFWTGLALWVRQR